MIDFEKKYNEAMERAKEMCAMPTDKATMEYIFPELRESEDERIRKFLLDYAVEMIAGLESDISLSTYDGIKGHDPESEEELAQWQKARAYIERQKEQKPAWSEEDTLMLTATIQTLERFGGRGTTGMQIDWLKSLRPRHITYALDAPLCYDNDMNPIYPPINHWKPSEEQMAVLLNAEGLMRANDYKENARILAELYKELKKL